jgi:WD40 repeat protein
VMRAQDRELGRAVAIKELLVLNRSSELRFFREAMITARLEHPNIVPVHEAGRWPDGRPFYTMKLVAGTPLSELIGKRQSIGQRLALLPHVIAVADAVSYAHSKGIVHRDLKPANVIVGTFGETVVIDWGLAKAAHNDDQSSGVGDALADEPATEEATRAGSIVGTPAYMAPEQKQGRANAKTDIYSLGALLYNLLTQQLLPISRQKTRHRLGVPRDLVSIASRATEQEPSHRYSSMTEMADDLRRYMLRLPVSARNYGVASRLALFVSRHRNVAVAAAVFFFAILVLSLSATALLSRQQSALVAAERTSHAARTRAEERVDELRIANARLLLSTDPTQAHENAISADPVSQFLRSEARALGIATKVLRLHSDSPMGLGFAANGKLLSGSKAIVGTDTEKWASVTVASGVISTVTPAFSRDGLAAYVVANGDLVVTSLDGVPLFRSSVAGSVSALALSTDGRSLAAQSSDGNLKLWDVQDGTLKFEVASPRCGEIRIVDNARVVCIAAEGYSVLGGRREIGAHFGSDVSARGVNRDGSAVITGHLDGAITIWSTMEGRPLITASVCTSTVKAVAIAVVAAYACHDRNAGFLSATGKGRPHRFILDSPIRRLSVDDGGSFVAAGVETGTVHIVDVATANTIELRGHSSPVVALSFDPSRAGRLASADAKGQIRVWDHLRLPAQLLMTIEDSPYGMRFSHNGRHLAIGSRSGQLRLVLWGDRSVKMLRGHESFVYRVNFTQDDRYLVSADFHGNLASWSPETGEQIRFDKTHNAAIQDLALTNDANQVLAAGFDGRLVRWNIETGEASLELAIGQPIIGVETFPASNDTIVAGADGTIWRGGGSDRFVKIAGSEGVADTMLLASPAGRWVAMGNARGEVTILSLHSNVLIHVARLPDGIRHLAFTPDERNLAIASEGDTVAIVQMRPFWQPKMLTTGTSTRLLRFSDGGQKLAMIGSEGAIRFYEIETGRWMSYRAHEGYINSGTFSPSGLAFLSAGADGRIVMLDMDFLVGHN